MIREILGNKTAVKLLRELFKEPKQEFKEIELIKRAGTGKGSANKIINNLIRNKILIEKRIGKTKMVNLNTDNDVIFLLKVLFDQEKICSMDRTRLASLYLFRNITKEKAELIVVFGSTISGTSNKESDIDLLLVTNNLEEINKKRGEIEELFGERFNLHIYKKKEIISKIERDNFIKNSFINGVIIHGFDFGRAIFSNFKEKYNLDRLFFLRERIKSALKNYQNKDNNTAKEILEKTLEQLIFYLLSENNINYSSKYDAKKNINLLPEGEFIDKISNSSLKESIILSEELILNIIKNKILE